MNKIATGLVALALAATPALAQAPLTFADVDTDASGELSFAELQAVWPDLTQEEFTVADQDANGSLSPAELDALQLGAEALPAPADDGAALPETPGESLVETTD